MTTLATAPLDLRSVPPVLVAGADGVTRVTVRDTWTTTSADDAWARAVVARLRGRERALVALAFEPDGPAVAHRVALVRTPATAPEEVVDRHLVVTERPSPAAFAASVDRALERIVRGDVDKVVLGRGLDVVADPPLDPATVVAGLLRTRPGAHVFSVPLGPDVRGPLLLGASPELLLRRSGLEVSSTPLAGSVPRSSDPVEDAARAERLAGSTKDLREHAFVVDAIRETLAPWCSELDAPSTPVLLSTDTLWHLATPIRGTLLPDAPGALELARALHPTPAVGGTPRTAALDLVAELEGEPRGPLTGLVGWVDGHGDGELAVTIRAGVLDGGHLRLFAGAGVVAGSEAWSEVRETAAKLATMRSAVGL